MSNRKCTVVSLALCFATVVASTSGDWQDCDTNASSSDGPYTAHFLDTVLLKQQLFVQYPRGALPEGKSGWPVVIFMHAFSLGYEWYEPQMQRLASHGIVAVFPFIKSQADDDTESLSNRETTGEHLEAALDVVRKGLLPDLKLDVSRIAFAGHNMGAVSAIRVAAKLPKGTAKLIVAMHPFPCNIGPPPYPFTVSSQEIKQANDNAPLVYTTSEDDNAFGPFTASREKSCYGSAAKTAIFLSFKTAACSGAFPDCKDVPDGSPWGAVNCKSKLHPFGKGHMCPTSVPGYPKFTSPEAKWLVTSLRVSLQLGPDSKCFAQLWGSAADSLSADPNVADKDLQRDESANEVVV